MQVAARMQVVVRLRSLFACGQLLYEATLAGPGPWVYCIRLATVMQEWAVCSLGSETSDILAKRMFAGSSNVCGNELDIGAAKRPKRAWNETETVGNSTGSVLTGMFSTQPCLSL